MTTAPDGDERGDQARDWQDRAIDAALQELHGSKPPDLSARVLLALREPARGPLPVLHRPRRSYLIAWSAAAALLLAVFAIGWLRREAPPEVVENFTAELEFEVSQGAFECVALAPGAARTVWVEAGTQGVFTARVGNRLRCADMSYGQLGTFGPIAAWPHTELEVRSMEFSLKNGVVAASALTLSVVAGVVTWHTLTRSETAVAGEVVRMEAGADRAAQLAAENAQLRQRITQLEQQAVTAAAAPLRIQAPAAPAEAPAVPAAAQPDAPVPLQAALFHDERFSALDAIDWATVGAATKEMGPLLAQMMEEMAKTGEVPTELAIKIQELNGKLVAQVPAMLKAGMPGFGPNGAYTHPLVVANVLGSTLQAAGQPLNESQQAAIAGLVRAFGMENQGIVDQTREFELEHLAAEAAMKDRFYKEVSTLLTPEQYAKMYPEGGSIYDGANLFASGLMTRPYSEPVSAKDAGDFARLASHKLGEQLGLDEATSAQVRAVVERIASASPEIWQDKAGVVESKLRMLKSGRTAAALQQQLAVMREIQRQVSLTPEQKKKLASLKHVLVPLPR